MNYDSVILNAVLALLGKLSAAYYASAFAKLVKRAADFGKMLFSGSSIWNFIKRDDFLSEAWDKSAVFLFLERVLNFPSELCRRFVFKHEQVFSSSLSVRVVNSVTARFGLLVGIFAAAIFIVPHERWNNGYAVAGVLLLIVLFFLKTVFRTGESFSLKPVDFALFLFMLAAVLAAALSLFPSDSLKFLVFYITCFLLLLIMASSLKEKGDLGLMIDVMLAGASASGLYGIYQAVKGVPVNAALTDIELNAGMPGRVFSTMGNPNNFAEVLVMTLPFFLAAVFNTPKLFRKLLYLALALPPLASLFYTGSRSGWIAFAAAILVFVFLKNRKLVPLIIMLGMLCVPILPEFVYRRIMTVWNPQDTSAAYRVKIYMSVIPILRDFWVTGLGLGPGPFMKVSSWYHQFTRAAVAHSHNLYLEIWLETGFTGFASFVWFVLRAYKKSFVGIFGKSDAYVKNILIAAVSSLTGILIMGMAEYVLFYPRVMLVFWIDIGIILTGLSILSKRRAALSIQDRA